LRKGVHNAENTSTVSGGTQEEDRLAGLSRAHTAAKGRGNQIVHPQEWQVELSCVFEKSIEQHNASGLANHPRLEGKGGRQANSGGRSKIPRDSSKTAAYEGMRFDPAGYAGW
jgi:hypothetical protein